MSVHALKTSLSMWNILTLRSNILTSPLACHLVVLTFAAIFYGLVFTSAFVGLAIALFGAILCVCAKKCFSSDNMVSIVLFSFIIGILIAMLIFFGYSADYGLPFWVPGADDQVYEQVADYVYNSGYLTVFDMFQDSDRYIRTHNAKGWIMFLVYLMHAGDFLGGYHTMVPRITSLFALNIMGIIVTYHFQNKHRASEKWGAFMFLCMTLLPNAVILSSHIYRDTISALLVTSCYFIALRLYEKRHIVINLLAIGILAYMAYWLRAMNLFFIAGICIIALFPETIRRKQLNSTFTALVGVTVLVAIILLAVFGDLFLGYIIRYGESIASGEGRFASLIYGVPLLPFGIFLRMSLYLVTPFYYRVVFDPTLWFTSTENITHLLISLGTLVLVANYVYAFKGARADYKTALALLVVLAGICISTSGYRHIMMVYPLLILLIAEGRYDVGKNFRLKVVYRNAAFFLFSILCLLFCVASIA